MNNFQEIEHRPLRLYNLSVMAYNIYEDCGQAAFEDYIDSISAKDKADMIKMIKLVRLKGTKYVISKVTEGMTFSDEEAA